MEELLNLLFEISNDYRFAILLLLHEKPLKITEIAKSLQLTTQEISRHISRLVNVGITYKDVEGQFHVSPYGEIVLALLEEFQFISKHKTYFLTHIITQLPLEFVKQIGELSNSVEVNNVMEFLHYIDQSIKEAEEFVWLCVDQYPLTAIVSISNALKRGIRFRVIEFEEMLNKPKLSLESPEVARALAGTRRIPLGEQKILKNIDFFMILTEKKCAISFPTKDRKFDYKGFISSDDRSRIWCKYLFQNLWNSI